MLHSDVLLRFRGIAMYFKQFYLGCLAHASYLVGDLGSGIAAVIDPQRDIEQYIEEAAAQKLEIKYVLLTHFHADFVAGHLELEHRTGAKIMLGAAAQADYKYETLRDGESIELGKSCRLQILETPGHTPEGISILVFDLKDGEAQKPWAVLTGDTLFVGDVGRPDLLASVGVTAEELAGQLYDSLHNKLLVLPDSTRIYPAHGAGSMCGKNLGKESFSTIGEQKKLNYALRISSKQDFIATLCADQPEAPAYFIMNATLNKQERQKLHEHMPRALSTVSIEQLVELQRNGAQILDTRGPSDYAKGHIKGSFNIGLGGNFASWSGTVLDHKTPIVVVADTGKEEEAIMRLSRIGYDNVVGYLDGGPTVFLFRSELNEQFDRLSAKELSLALQSGSPPRVLDVRTEAEWNDKHIAGAINIPLNQLSARIGELPKNERIVIHCLGGYRSMIATSILAKHGFANLSDLHGGINAWIESSLPVTRETAGASCGS